MITVAGNNILIKLLLKTPYMSHVVRSPVFFFKHTPTTQIYTLSLHDALPIYGLLGVLAVLPRRARRGAAALARGQPVHENGPFGGARKDQADPGPEQGDHRLAHQYQSTEGEIGRAHV